VVGVLLQLLLEIRDGCHGQFVDAAAVVGPAPVAIEERNYDTAMSPIQIVETYQRQKNAVVALAGIFDARFVGIMAEVVEVDVTGQVTAVTEKRSPSRTRAFAYSGITWAAKACNEVVENLLAFGLGLLWHHVVRVLGSSAGNKNKSSDEQGCGSDS